MLVRSWHCRNLEFARLPMKTAHQLLHDIFGYETFRGAQEAIVAHVAAGGDALVNRRCVRPGFRLIA
jgi:hypothetical protein